MNFSGRARRRAAVDINMTPLIDIVFILLIFFLMTSTFIQDSGFKVDLPSASAENADEIFDALVVQITSRGEIVLQGTTTDAAGLATELTRLKEKLSAESKNPTVMVQADEDAPHGVVVQVLDTARLVGLTDLAIGTYASP